MPSAPDASLSKPRVASRLTNRRKSLQTSALKRNAREPSIGSAGVNLRVGQFRESSEGSPFRTLFVTTLFFADFATAYTGRTCRVRDVFGAGPVVPNCLELLVVAFTAKEGAWLLTRERTIRTGAKLSGRFSTRASEGGGRPLEHSAQSGFPVNPRMGPQGALRNPSRAEFRR